MDSDDWKYLGEGGLNIVLSYIGSDPSYIGKILRLTKTTIGKDARHGGQTFMDPLIYAKGLSRVVWGEEYSHYFSNMTAASVDRHFLNELSNKIAGERPEHRIKASQLNIYANKALLLDNALIIDHGHENMPTLTLEIKPKWFVEGSDWNLAKEKCFYCTYQLFKFSDIAPEDLFCPCKFYSNNFELLSQVIYSSLKNTCSRQLKIHYNSQLYSLQDAISCLKRDAFFDAEDEDMGQWLSYLISTILLRDTFLHKLSAAIRAFSLDEVEVFYKRVGVVLDAREEVSLSAPYEYFLNKGRPLKEWEGSLALSIAQYLISRTLRDCSFFISIWPAISAASTNGAHKIEIGNKSYGYKIQVIDLDEKSVHKIPYYQSIYHQLKEFGKKKLEKADKCLDLCK